MILSPKTYKTDEFDVRDGVPVLDEHILHDSEGKILAEMTADKLETIARNNNRKIAETGDEVPIIVGHTKDHKDEDEQPEIIGLADKFRVAWLFNTGRKAIFARLKFFRDKAHLIAKYPRRSVELWLKKLEIDPISVLGASTPERPLGLLRYSSGDGLHYSHLVEDHMDQTSNDMVSQVVAAIQQLPEWKALQQILQQMQGGQKQQAPPAAGAGGPQQMAAYDAEDFDAEDFDAEDFDAEADFEAEDYAGLDGAVQSQKAGIRRMGVNVKATGHQKLDAEDFEGEDYAANASRSISAQVGGAPRPVRGDALQTFGPRNNQPRRQRDAYLDHGDIGSAVRSVPPHMGSNKKLQADSLRVRLARSEREIARQQAVNTAVILKLRAAERRADLITLEGEGIMFDPNSEYTRGMNMTDNQWNEHVDLMRVNYSRAAINDPLGGVLEHASTNPTPHARTKDEARQIAQYATDNKITYEAALEKFTSQPTNQKVF
jgi:hypothetical protein